MKTENASNDSSARSEASVKNKMEKSTAYTIDGRKFIVTPVFQENGRESFGSLLMRLMKAEVSPQL